jgi:hypothetical protein
MTRRGVLGLAGGVIAATLTGCGDEAAPPPVPKTQRVNWASLVWMDSVSWRPLEGVAHQYSEKPATYVKSAPQQLGRGAGATSSSLERPAGLKIMLPDEWHAIQDPVKVLSLQLLQQPTSKTSDAAFPALHSSLGKATYNTKDVASDLTSGPLNDFGRIHVVCMEIDDGRSLRQEMFLLDESDRQLAAGQFEIPLPIDSLNLKAYGLPNAHSGFVAQSLLLGGASLDFRRALGDLNHEDVTARFLDDLRERGEFELASFATPARLDANDRGALVA